MTYLLNLPYPIYQVKNRWANLETKMETLKKELEAKLAKLEKEENEPPIKKPMLEEEVILFDIYIV